MTGVQRDQAKHPAPGGDTVTEHPDVADGTPRAEQGAAAAEQPVAPDSTVWPQR